MIEFQKYKYSIGGKEVFNIQNFVVSTGDKIWLKGKSGSGKSLFLLGLAGWYAKDAHAIQEVSLDDADSVEEISEKLQNTCSIIFQQPRAYLNPLLSCGELIQEAAHKDIENPHFEILRLCSALKLKYDEQIFQVKPNEISIGEAQRVMIAMALIRRCPILLADEPFAHLDLNLAQHCLSVLETEIEPYNGSMIISSHDHELLQNRNYRRLSLLQAQEEMVPDRRERIPIKNPRAIIDIKGLSKRFGKIQILQNLDLTIRAGERIGLFGVSGSGKSTLANIIAGLEQPTSIEKGFGIQDHFSLSKIWSRPVSSAFIIYQDPYSSFHPSKSIEKQLFDIEKAKKLVGLLSLNDDVLERLPSQLSGGELQRLCVIRGLSNAALPKVLILDEGLSALNDQMRYELLNLLETSYPDLAVLFISHRLHLIEPYCDIVYELTAGRLVQVDEIK